MLVTGRAGGRMLRRRVGHDWRSVGVGGGRHGVPVGGRSSSVTDLIGDLRVVGVFFGRLGARVDDDNGHDV